MTRSVLLLAFLVPASAMAQPGSPLAASSFQTTQTDTLGYRFLVALPDGYGAGDEVWPLVLFLHGAGERGGDLAAVAVHGPARHVREGERFPFVLVAPQAPAGAWWDPQALGALLDHAEQTYRIDPDRVYVTGLSMGGYGTWALAEAFPDRFAAIAPVCGGGTPSRICPAAEAGLPVWAFHGALDDVVPLQRSLEMVQRYQRCGGVARLTVYPDAGHDSWTATYANPELYAWLLAQRRPAAGDAR